MNDTINGACSLARAIDDGVLVAVFKNRWGQLSAGTPIVATRHVFATLSLAAYATDIHRHVFRVAL